MTDELKPGTVVQWQVSGPAPECDMALVLECHGPRDHTVKYKVWGQGDFHISRTRAELWPVPRYPMQWSREIEAMLQEEWGRIEASRGDNG